MKFNRPFQRRAAAFTLIELLVVIAIIALLAALILWGTTIAGEKKVRTRVTAELQGLQLAIDGFHKQFGFYPASNPDTNQSAYHPLFYELTGTVHNQNASEFTDILGVKLVRNQIQKLGVEGFVNAAKDRSESPNFLRDLKSGAHAEVTVSGSNLRFLAVPYKGPVAYAGPNGSFNLWHYNSTNAVNNPETYDLWAEVVIAGKTNVIGNWKE